MPARNSFVPRALVAAAIFAAAGSVIVTAPRPAHAAETPDPLKHFEGEYVAPNFHFASGETLPELRIHYTVLGKPHRDAHGHVDNAVLILHGTGGSGHNFLTDKFGGVLFGKGRLLDTTRYFIILPDGIGHGQSSRPSDGLHARFPQYDYQDMVAAQYALVTLGLEVDHLRFVLGTSMGCMHPWISGETPPTFLHPSIPLPPPPVPTQLA